MFNKTDIEKYFTAEKSWGLAFLVIGVVAIVLALVFQFILKSNFYRGFAVPLITIALIQATVGYTVYKRSDNDRKRNTYAYDLNPSELKQKEVPRMEKVNKSFFWYGLLELALLITGLVLIVVFRNEKEKAFWYGCGIGLAIQATLMLGADYLASARAKMYTTGLKTFLESKK